jgi:hypothetical protein
MITPQGLVTRQFKIYVTPYKIRINNVYHSSRALIFRRDTNVQLLLNPVTKTYIMEPLNISGFTAFRLEHVISSSQKTLGTETVNGFTCSIKMLENTASFSGEIRKIISTIWVSPRLSIPIRTKSQDGLITELRNVQAGTFQPALFDPPTDYKKVLTVQQ